MHSDYDELPGEVFTKSYVRAYADYLGLDVDEMAQLYLDETVDRRAAESTAADEQVVREMSRVLNVSSDRSPSPLWIAGVIVLLLLAVAVGWWWFAEPAPAETAAVISPSVTPPITIEPSAPDVAARTTADAPVESTPASRGTIEGEPKAAASVVPVEPQPSPPQDSAEPELDAGRVAAVAVISEFGVGSAVQDRALVGRADHFEQGSEVWFWNRILGAEPGTILQHVWIHEGTEVSRISLAIGGSHWRTQSRKTLYPGSIGQWAVEVRDPAGRTLARTEFLCEDPA